MAFICLTEYNGEKVYINFNYVVRYYRREGYGIVNSRVVTASDFPNVDVQESVAEIENLLQMEGLRSEQTGE